MFNNESKKKSTALAEVPTGVIRAKSSKLSPNKAAALAIGGLLLATFAFAFLDGYLNSDN